MLWKLIISGKFPLCNAVVHVEPTTGARRCGRSSAAKYSGDDQRRRREDGVGVRRWGFDGVAGEGGDAGDDTEGHVTGTVSRQQAMNSLEMEEWRKARRKWNFMATRPNTSSWLGPRCLMRGTSNRVARSRCTNIDSSLKGSGRSKGCTTRKSIYPPQRQRGSVYVGNDSG